MNTANSNYQPGQPVRIRAEWCDAPAERDMIYVVIENNGDRLIIESTDPQFAIKPQSVVLADWIEAV